VVVPVAFVTLYSVLEMQAAARAADKGDSRLATLRVVTMAVALDNADRSGGRRQELTRRRHEKLITLFEARNKVRARAVDILTATGVEGASAMCAGSPADLKLCQIDHKLEACTADWLKISDCYQQAMPKARAAVPALADEAARLRDSMDIARDEGFKFNSISASLRDSATLEDDPLLPVAESYRTIGLPFFTWLFILPQGVVVACFTSLMACIGAGVGSLVARLRRRRDAPDADAYFLKAFLASPLLGALTGFMVYFVISAGTAFLVPQQDSAATTAVNNLSVPALASLGVFAGLAAEDAIAWLTDKARSFFGKK
jgi:hypothetical protein